LRAFLILQGSLIGSFVTNFWTYKKSRKEKRKNIKRKFKIQEDIHEEGLEDCPSWWWMTKITSEKIGRPKCIKLEKLTIQFWLTKGPIGENIFIWGKEIQIWIGKDSIRILEGLINFIEDLIARKIIFRSQFRC
jgi:hypothetical protein